MRRVLWFVGFLALSLAGSVPALAQEVGEAVTLRGCLAQDEDDEMEYLLE
ncbi:MAG: hypothetical protein GWO17_25365, partial [Gemmatimonadetes bacterium]|nr:hypothetical protein [Gemmatimonadota bacterium]